MNNPFGNQQLPPGFGPPQPQPQPQYQQPAPQPAYDPFAQVAGASAILRPDYAEPGRYAVQIDSLKMVQSSKDGQPVYVINFTVAESDQAHTPPGSQRGQAIKYHPAAPKAWESELKTFMLVALRELEKPAELASDPRTYHAAFGGDGTALAGRGNAETGQKIYTLSLAQFVGGAAHCCPRSRPGANIASCAATPLKPVPPAAATGPEPNRPTTNSQARPELRATRPRSQLGSAVLII